MDQIEAIATIELVYMAALGVIVTDDKILGGVAAGEWLDRLADAYGALSAATKFNREAAQA